MLFTSIATLLLPMVVFGAPAALDERTIESCTPTSYTLSDFTLSTSPSAASVTFIFQSTFVAGSNATDVVTSGAICHAADTSLPFNNECSVESRRLLFDLAGPQETAHYQITHTWACDGKTWMSGNDVVVKNLQCSTDRHVTVCTAGSQPVEPQDVRSICTTPTC